MRAALLAAAAAAPARGAVTADRVDALPGWAGALPSAVYSGYFAVAPQPPHTETRHLHYVFIESMGDPAADPVMLWVNGGPGSSSLKGVFSQLGPFSANDASFAPPAGSNSSLALLPNPSTWNRFSSVLYLEQPAGVGFSYCNKTMRRVEGHDNCAHSDSSAAADNLALLKQFFAAYSEFLPNPLYLSGVSYGGVYVPTLAGLVLDDGGFNLRGVAVGNPTFRWGVDGDNLAHAPQSVQGITELRMDMLGGHGQFSPALYAELKSTCTFFNNGTVRPEERCEELLAQMHREVGGYDLYNIYDTCKLAGDDVALGAPPDDTRFGYCGQERALVAYCNEDAVRAALHVPPAAELGAYHASASGEAGWSYHKDEHDTRQYYLRLLERGVRVLVYSGDVDNCLPYTGSMQWVQLLGQNETEAWRPWTLDGGQRMGGYVVTYGDGVLVFATVRGAGHMVPEFRPAEAAVLMKQWLLSQPLPGYKKGARGVAHTDPSE